MLITLKGCSNFPSQDPTFYVISYGVATMLLNLDLPSFLSYSEKKDFSFFFCLFPSDTDHSLHIPSRHIDFLTLYLKTPPITFLPTSLKNLQTQIHDFLSVSSLHPPSRAC